MSSAIEGTTKRNDLLTVEDVSMLEGLNMQIAKICVWAHHQHRFEQGLMLLRQQQFNCTEVMLRDIARFFRSLWQLDVPRQERSRCFLCSSKLPDQSDELCKCFRECQVGRYLDPITPQTLDELKRMYPNDWHKITVETVICEQPSCGRLMAITAGVVQSRLAKGKGWKSPKLCMNCFHEKQGQMQQGQFQGQGQGQGPRHERPRKHGGPLKTTLQEGAKGKVALRDLQDTVAAEAPEVAES